MNGRFQDIDFGLASAENEKTNSPDLLIHGFLDNNRYIEKILNNHYFLIHGQKGSGKSAIASKLEIMSEDKNMNVKIQNMSDFDYPRFEKVLPEESTKDLRNIDTWELLLSISLFEMFSKDKETTIKKSKITIKQIVDGLITLGILPAENLRQILNGVTTKNYKFSAKIFSSEKTINPKDTSISTMRNTLIDALYKVRAAKKNLLIIDGLDGIISKGPRQYRVLASLIRTASDMNRKLKDHDVDAKIVILCRTDLLDKLEDPNKNKIIQDSSIELDWYQDVKDVERVNLYELINLRASNSLKRTVNVVSEFLPIDMHHNKTTSQFLIEQTRHTPRDMVQLMNYIKEHKGNINKDSVFNSIRAYSTKYFIEEIKDELVGFTDRGELDSLFDIFSSMGKSGFSLQDLIVRIKERNIDLDPVPILKSLFDCGAIANINAMGGRYTFKYRNRRSSFDPYEKIFIHSALHHALRVGVVGGMGKDDS